MLTVLIKIQDCPLVQARRRGSLPRRLLRDPLNKTAVKPRIVHLNERTASLYVRFEL